MVTVVTRCLVVVAPGNAPGVAVSAGSTPVDHRFTRRLHPDADPIVVGGLDGVANLNLIETGPRLAAHPESPGCRAAIESSPTGPCGRRPRQFP